MTSVPNTRVEGNVAKSDAPRIDYYKTVLLLRQEGMLTNKLNDKALANLLEIIMEKAIQDNQSMCKETGNFEVDLKKEDEKKEE